MRIWSSACPPLLPFLQPPMLLSQLVLVYPYCKGLGMGFGSIKLHQEMFF